MNINEIKIGENYILSSGTRIYHYIQPDTIVKLVGFRQGKSVEVEGLGLRNKVIKQTVHVSDLKNIINKTNTINQKVMNTNQLMQAAVVKAANELVVANNTFSTLELKLKLRKDEPSFYWTQATVSAIMDDLSKQGKYTYTDNGTFRTYSDPARKAPVVNKVVKTVTKTATPVKKSIVTTNGTKISRTKALDLMKNSKGHFFTVEFMKKDGSTRILNGQWVKNQTEMHLGYILVKESAKLKAKVKEPIRNVNLQTLKALKIDGQVYQVR